MLGQSINVWVSVGACLLRGVIYCACCYTVVSFIFELTGIRGTDTPCRDVPGRGWRTGICDCWVVWKICGSSAHNSGQDSKVVLIHYKKILRIPFGIMTDCRWLDELTSVETAHAGTPSEAAMHTVSSCCSAGDSCVCCLRSGMLFVRNWKKILQCYTSATRWCCLPCRSGPSFLFSRFWYIFAINSFLWVRKVFEYFTQLL